MTLRTNTLLLWAAVLCLAAPAGAVGEQEGGIVDSVVAVVNEKRILYSDVARNVAPLYRKLSQAYSGDELRARLDQAFKDTLEAMIEKRLILDANENPNPAAIDLMVEEQMDEVVTGSFKSDRTAFLEALAAERMSLQEWKTQIRENILFSAFRRKEVDSKVLVAPGAARAFYDANAAKFQKPEEVQLRMIVMSRGKSTADAAAAKEQADSIRNKAAAGGDFVALARSVSEDPGEKAEPRWASYKDLKTEVAQVVSKLKEGEVSPVIESGDSFFILKVEGRREAKDASFDEVRGEIEQQLRQREYSRIYDDWIARLRKRAYVKVIDLGKARK